MYPTEPAETSLSTKTRDQLPDATTIALEGIIDAVVPETDADARHFCADDRDGRTRLWTIVRTDFPYRDLLETGYDKRNVRHTIATDPADVGLEDVDSSNVDKIGFLVHPNPLLYIRFLDDDGTYVYREVEEDVWTNFCYADSKGRYVHEKIKGHHDFVKVPDLDQADTDG
jgi:hypothetical protein